MYKYKKFSHFFTYFTKITSHSRLYTMVFKFLKLRAQRIFFITLIIIIICKKSPDLTAFLRNAFFIGLDVKERFIISICLFFVGKYGKED